MLFSHRRALFVFAPAVLLICSWVSAAEPLPPGQVDYFSGKPRVLVLTDMGNEPDDQMSFVRFLLYANELDIEGLVAATSTWLKDQQHPETLRKIIEGYDQVRPNLLQHASGWPEAGDLLQRVSSGQPGYGMNAVGKGKMSPGAEAIIRAADREDKRPLWISVWGGANTLAQALQQVRDTRTAEELSRFVARLRVYSISDQDDAGPWIRREFPDLFYIVSPTSPDGGDYVYTTWTGIAGDLYYRNGAGADSELITNAWLERNIRNKGSFGKFYPEYLFIMEGDTPAYLNLLANGLNSYRNPGWGGWGGRYIYRQPYGETRNIWTQGGDLFRRVTSQDEVTGVDGRKYISDQATIWRWREAFQHDFAARMDWTMKSFDEANHPPQPEVNDAPGLEPLVIDAAVGQKIVLDASGSSDPDGDELQYRWFHYPEAGFLPDQALADVEIEKPDQAKTEITATTACRPYWLPDIVKCPEQGVAHVILAVTDRGEPSLTRYRRIILRVSAPAVNAE